MASRFRKIDPRIWNDEKFRSLTDDGKFVFLFLLTHPHMTALGAMRATIPGLAAELGWPAKRFTSALQQSRSFGIVEACSEAAWIGIPNFLRYNEPEGPNSVTKAWVAALELLPECVDKERLVHRCRSYLRSRTKAFQDAIGEGIWDVFGDAIKHAKPNPSSIQEPEKEPKLEPEKDMPQAVDESFERFWATYPPRNGKRLNRQEALRKWNRLNDQDRQLVLVAVRNYSQSKTVSDGIGIRDPHRWLCDGKGNAHWRDWIEPEKSTREIKNGAIGLPRTGFNEKNYHEGVF